MIPAHLRPVIAKKLADLTTDVYEHEKIGSFLFTFAALESDRDVEYAIDRMKESDDPLFKKAVGIVLDELVAIRQEPFEPVSPKGVWFVYSYDTMVYPIFISDDELVARRFTENIGYYVFLKFWEFGTEWSND